MSNLALLRRIPLTALLLGALVVLGAGVAGAAPIGQITEFSAPGTNPAQVVAGPDGNLWFSDRNGAVGQITTSGTVTRFTSGLNPGSAVRSIVMGADGNMWFSDPGTTRAVGMINPTTHAISEFSSGLNAGSMPLGIAPGPDGNVWFTDSGTTKAIGMINPTTHALTEFSSGLTPGTTLQQGLVAGPDGNLWFTESTPGGIGMINPTTHAISEFRIGLNPGSVPGASIVVGPDGALWFMDGGTTQAIGRIDPTTHAISEFSTGLNPGASLGRIAVGPDGNLWFGDKGTTRAIYVMNPTTHAITAFTSGLNAGSAPGGIWSGSDGNVWFTDQATNPTNPAIGRIGVGAAAASVTAPTVTGSGGVNLPQACGGDTWSTWAAQQPSHSAYGFDGYQWLLDGSPIAGATGQSYTPTASDAGHQLSCKATVTYPLLVVTASATSTAVHVKGAAEQLDDLADAVVGVGPGGSLAGKVRAIQGYVAANDTADACAALGAFINEVDAQTGKKISSTKASSLVTQAHNIEAALDS
jgi:streptogramin lyase